MEFRLNQVATKITGPMKRDHGLWTEYLFNFLIHIQKRDVFLDDTVEKIRDGISLQVVLR